MSFYRPGLVWLSDRDLADFGFVAKEIAGALGSFAQQWPTGQILGSSGFVVLGRDPSTSERTLTLSVTFTGVTPSELVAAVRELEAWCALGPLTLRTKHDPSLVFLCHLREHDLQVSGRQFRGLTIRGSLVFGCRNPYAWERTPQRYTGLTNTRIAVPTGTGPTQMTLWVTDAVNPQIQVRDAAGNVLRYFDLTLSQSVDDACMVDTPRAQITIYVAGVASDGSTGVVALGQGWPRLDPRVAHYETQQWHTVSTSGGRLWVDVRRSYLL